MLENAWHMPVFNWASNSPFLESRKRSEMGERVLQQKHGFVVVVVAVVVVNIQVQGPRWWANQLRS